MKFTALNVNFNGQSLEPVFQDACAWWHQRGVSFQNAHFWHLKWLLMRDTGFTL